MTNRYPQLTSLIPKGSFWDSLGEVLPFLSSGHQFRFVGEASRAYGVFDNERHLRNATTDSNGALIITLELSKGEHTVKLIDTITQKVLRAHITIRDWAVWHAAYAEVFEDLDTKIEAILAGSHITEANATYLDEVFGRQMRLPHELGHGTESYRNALQQLRQAYRLWSGRKLGVIQVPSALTNSAPLIVPKEWRPTWILGHQLLPNGDFRRSVRTTVSSTTNTGTTINSISDNNLLGAQNLTTTTSTVVWNGGVSTAVVAGQTLDVPGPQARTTMIAPANQSSSAYLGTGELWLEIGGHGIVKVDMTNRNTAALVAAAINTAFAAYNGINSYNNIADIVALHSDPTIKHLRIQVLLLPAENIVIHPNAYDAAIWLGLSPSRVLTTATVVVGATQFNVTDGTTMTDLAANVGAYDIRVGRGQAISKTSIGFVATGSFANFSVSPAPTIPLIGGTCEVTGATNASNNGLYSIVNVSGTTVTIRRDLGNFVTENTLNCTVRSVGEVVSLVQKTGTAIIVATGMAYAWNPVPYVEVSDELPRTWEAIPPATINVTLPVPVVAGTDAITVAGNNYPDGWQLTGSASTLEYLPDRRLKWSIPNNTGTDRVFSRSVGDFSTYRGREIDVTFHVQAHYAAPTFTFGIDADFGNGAGVISGTQVTVAETHIELYKPTQITQRFTVPWNTAETRIILTHNGQQTTKFATVSGASVRVVGATGQVLGAGTVPRSLQRANFGELLYQWSPAPVTAAERLKLGLPEALDLVQPVVKGHIDHAVNAHGVWERFDVSTYDGNGAPTNLLGAYTEFGWDASSFRNLSLQIGTPGKLSWLQPVTDYSVVGETLGAPNSSDVVTLDFVADANAVGRLYGDGIPFLTSEWSFTGDATGIDLTPVILLPTAVWTFDYSKLTQAMTNVIDLGTGHANLRWFVDVAMYQRASVVETTRLITREVQFSANLTARLELRSDLDESVSYLWADNGVTKTLVASDAWSYTDSQIVSIDINVFDENSIYTFTYNAKSARHDFAGTVELSWRAATSINGVAAQAWTTVKRDQVIDWTKRYHQLRVTMLSDDIRIHGLGLRGLNLATAPGLGL